MCNSARHIFRGRLFSKGAGWPLVLAVPITLVNLVSIRHDISFDREEVSQCYAGSKSSMRSGWTGTRWRLRYDQLTTAEQKEERDTWIGVPFGSIGMFRSSFWPGS